MSFVLLYALCILFVTVCEATRGKGSLSIPVRLAVSSTVSRRQRQSTKQAIVINIRSKSKSAKTMTVSQMRVLNLLSGGVAGTISSTITNPLEVIKTQLQSSASSSPLGRNPLHVAQQILSRDGFSGFFRGLPPTLIGIIPSRSVYFYAYQSVKHFLGGHGLVEGSPGNALVSGIAAGLCGNTLTNPIWMVRTRMQLLVDAAAGQKAYNGYADAIRTIWKDEGIGGFYKGIFASYWGCAEGALQFIVYEQLKTRLLRRENKKRARIGLPPTERLSEASYFFSAALAKALASVATYPHEVARTRLREQARGGQFIYKGMWQTIGLIGRWEGTAGLYSGMGVHLVKVVPNSAIMFLCYEMVNAWLSKFEVVENGGVPPTRIGS